MVVQVDVVLGVVPLSVLMTRVRAVGACWAVCVQLREVGPFPSCATPYSAPGVETEEFKLLKGRSSRSGVMFVVLVSVILLLAQLVHPPAPRPASPVALFFLMFHL